MAKIKNGSTQKKDKAAQPKDVWFDALKPNKMMNNAQRLISSAVNVLEEEIAAGIHAAKRLEKKVIDVDDVRGNPEELMNRIRRDTHEAVDLFLDAFTAITNHLGFLTKNIYKESNGVPTSTATKSSENGNTIPVITSEKPVKAGELAILRLSMSNSNHDGVVSISLIKTDLTCSPDKKILSRNIQLNPAILTLKPLEQKEITISIKVPKTSKPGLYCGLYLDREDSNIRTVIALEVI